MHQFLCKAPCTHAAVLTHLQQHPHLLNCIAVRTPPHLLFCGIVILHRYFASFYCIVILRRYFASTFCILISLHTYCSVASQSVPLHTTPSPITLHHSPCLLSKICTICLVTCKAFCTHAAIPMHKQTPSPIPLHRIPCPPT